MEALWKLIGNIIGWFIVLFVVSWLLYYGYNEVAPVFNFPVQRVEYGVAVAFVIFIRGLRSAFRRWGPVVE